MSENDEERRRAAEAAIDDAKANYDASRKIETKTHEDVVLKLELAEEAYKLLKQRQDELKALMEQEPEEIIFPDTLTESVEELKMQFPDDGPFIKASSELFYVKNLKVVNGDEDAAVEKTMHDVKEELVLRKANSDRQKPEGDPGWTGHH